MSNFFNNKTHIKKKQGIKKPWTEKYRPATIDEVEHQDEVTTILKKTLLNGDMPHMLFYGPPGTGKTSTILAISKQLFKHLYNDRVLELNASDERGINVIREKVKNFSQISAKSSYTSIPSFKIVILDEADSMTSTAQSALRRTIETYSKMTRFCLICNYANKIIKAISSRCVIFRFKPIPEILINKRLNEIKKLEKIHCNDNIIKNITIESNGDMRQAINILQSCYQLKGGNEIEIDDIFIVTGKIDDNIINEYFSQCKYKTDFIKLVSNIIAYGYSIIYFLSQLFNIVIIDTTINDSVKSKIIIEIAKTEKMLIDNADEYLQLLNLTIQINYIISKNIDL